VVHIRKVQPRRGGRDLLGVGDLKRRFLRRGYPCFEGLDEAGRARCGLLFLAYMRDLRKQFGADVANEPQFSRPGHRNRCIVRARGSLKRYGWLLLLSLSG
jgi:deferrochelatase/peroxidase EfeB